jgi:hypothetical protein
MGIALTERIAMKEAKLWHLSHSDVCKLKHAAALLNVLAGDSGKLEVLLRLQHYLVHRIRSRERVILRARKVEAKLRSSLRKGRLERAESKRVKRTLEDCSILINQARHWIFLWKCFGDGAACVYQSPYNLKLLLYDQDYNIKQEAGFITAKEGFDLEWEVLEGCLQKGLPVVLSDLTNMIRIGDVCSLAGEDPLPLEVKSSKTSGARAARQQQLLNEVTAFYQNDGAEKFKGLHNVGRLPMPGGDDYRRLMNDCIQQARADGYSIVSPEPGLHYAAVTSIDKMGILDELVRPWVLPRLLTADPGWVPCLPFTVTLEPDNLIPFIAGKVAVFVMTDMEYLKSLFLQHGSHATMIMDGQSAIQLCVDPNNLMRGVVRISELHFGRVALEFQSLAWFAKENAISKQERERSFTLEEFEALPKDSYCFEIPEAWRQVRDFYQDALNRHDKLTARKP